jgi:hypothetical protein
VQVRCDEGVAIHIGPKPCVCAREGAGEASAGERIRPAIEPRKSDYPGRRRFNPDGRRHGGTRHRERPDSPARSETLACAAALCPGTGRSLAHPGRLGRRIASGR